MKLFCFAMAVSLAAFAASGGVRKIPPGSDEKKSFAVDFGASAGLFVGVRDFEDENLTPVKYAVDDAVDLAYELAIEHRPPLLEPKRVALVLSGAPQKPESQESLRKLKDAGASESYARQSEILKLLRSQSKAVGRNGLLIIAFATHGISEDGTQYLFAATSLLDYRETMLSEARISDVIASNGVERSLVLIDACRERLTRDRRTGDLDPRSVAGFMNTLSDIDGQVVLSAAALGGYAYDDDTRRNGVFTAAVIDGLRCGAATDDNGFVTVDALSSYVEDHVLDWIRKNKNAEARRATQLLCDGRSKAMPLTICVNHTAPASPSPAE